IEEGNLDAEKERKARYKQYKLPVLDYLSDPPQVKNLHTEEELREKANQLVHALETYGVSGRVVRISPGPVITLFEIEPAEGVRVNKFTNLADDLARVMKAQRVRIIAPIPGSKSVGVEIPNDNPATVFLKNIINSEQYIRADSKLSISLGKTTTGEAYVFDLGNMPHLLVAGATGAGKSVCINTMIVSILYKSKPDEVKFILVDPKKLELATYKSLVGYHLITAPNLDEYVMTTPENAVGILDSAIVEMERRFQVFADARVRNISEYHERRKENPELEPAPYIVVVIDELADLMLTSGRAVEEPIARLAQKARAVGIHLIVATQRPSVDVITGVIKSNFPARIAFQVSSKVDSRTILDQMGAEKLLGRGDMLFLLPGTASPIRLHNAFITLEEIEAVMEHISSQPKPEEILLPETRKEKVDGDFSLDEDQDELLKDAAVLVIQSQQASVSLLQRKFRIGYSRAGRLIDELEALGIISGYSGSKARDVLVDESYLANVFGE
ncbi:MAG: DNA translocase FtsK, partial [Candidatus Marinimicrobia bacterium]|nr:DNA translocase FtsK [Candidatus Neomarinimicrobiota bacterium]